MPDCCRILGAEKLSAHVLSKNNFIRSQVLCLGHVVSWDGLNACDLTDRLSLRSPCRSSPIIQMNETDEQSPAVSSSTAVLGQHAPSQTAAFKQDSLGSNTHARNPFKVRTEQSKHGPEEVAHRHKVVVAISVSLQRLAVLIPDALSHMVAHPLARVPQHCCQTSMRPPAHLPIDRFP